MTGMCQQCGDPTNDLRLVEFPRIEEGGFNTGDYESAWLCRECRAWVEDRFEGKINRC